MKKKFKPLAFISIFIILLVVIAGSLIGTWFYLCSPVDKNDKELVSFEVKSGANSIDIANQLKEKDLIKNVTVFRLYLKLNKVSSLKASNYKFSKSMSLEEIIKSLEKGVINNENAVKVTFPDGERITKYASIISDNFDYTYDEVISYFTNKEKASEYISKYWFLTDNILNEAIYYPLEGYLAPDTYYFDKDSSIDVIVTRMLSQMESNLEQYKDKIKDDPHYYLSMASLVQLEGTNTENRKMIAGVFINRLNNGYNLGSDVTTYYALQADMKYDLTKDQFAVINPYNTRGGNMIGKMPIGPICNPGESAIEAGINPTENEYFFFVADKHGKIYYTKTNAEHDKKVQEIKAAGDWIFE